MITITYQYTCDICEKPISEPETYKVMPFVPARITAIPHPQYRNQVGFAHVCNECFCAAAAALHARYADPAARKKTGDAMRGITRSAETRAKMSAAAKARGVSAATRAAQKQAVKGIKPSAENLEKRRAAMKASWADPAVRARRAEVRKKKRGLA